MNCPKCNTNNYRSRLDEYQSLYSQTHHLHRLRTTNEPPSEGEIDYVHNTVLRAIQDDTVHLETRLGELHSAVNALIQERNQLIQYASSFKSLLSPIRRLPPELLMEIFQHACTYDTWDTFYRGTQTHWVLPHVCREWRRVALSCPTLWTSIHAFLKQPFPHIPTLDAMLVRSGTRPLIVRLVNYNSSDGLQVRDFVGLLRTQSTRWRVLEINAPYNAIKDVFDLLRGSYPLLDRLDIHIESLLLSPLSELRKPGFSKYPSLRTVVLRDFSVMETLDLPWAQITTLIITNTFGQDLASYIGALCQCPSLQKLQVDPGDYLSAIEDTSLMVPLLSLKRLDLAIANLTDHLIVPRLEEVRLEVEHPSDYDRGTLSGIIPSFHNLVLRSKCALTITSLHIKKIPLSEDLIAVLSQTTNLATLDIRAKMSHPDTTPNTAGMKTIMSLLATLHVQPFTEPPFLPKLSYLAIGLSKHMDKIYFPYLKNQDDLVQALQSRWNEGRPAGVERLRTFRFGIYAQCLDDKNAGPDDSPCELYTDVEQALQVLVNDGMKISIYVHSKFARDDVDHVRVSFGST